MKVKDLNEVQGVGATGPVSSGGRSARLSSTTDRVTTSDKDRLSSSLASAQAAVKDSRAASVDAIAAAFQRGAFKPDPKRIASKMLDDQQITSAVQAMLKD